MRILLLCVFLAGCHHGAVDIGGKMDVPLTPTAASDDEIVATVDGRPIRASDIARQAGAAQTTTKQALDDLITAETLAAEAKRRQLDLTPDAQQEASQAAARRYLATSFERDITPANVPDRLVRRAYNANVNLFDHSEYADVWHILVPTKGATPEQKAKAKETAAEIAKLAKGVKNADEFKALAGKVTSPTVPPKVERIVSARDGWVERPFSEAAFTQLKKPGDTTGVVETSYGYHVEYLNHFIPAVHKKLADVDGEIRQKLFPNWQKEEFLRWYADLAKSHDVKEHAERLK